MMRLGDTPVPIPNTTVKTQAVDGTWWAAAWESRWSPKSYGLIAQLVMRRIDALRTLTTEALAVLMPFKAQEIRHQGGVYYGQNTISKNLILANRWELLNANGFVLGVSGSGKSFTAKRELAALALSTDDAVRPLFPFRPLRQSA